MSTLLLLMEIRSLTEAGSHKLVYSSSIKFECRNSLLSSPLLGSYMCATIPGSNVGPEDMSYGFYACHASSLLTVPSPKPLNFSLCQFCINFKQLQLEIILQFSDGMWIISGFLTGGTCPLFSMSTAVLTQ